MMKMMLGFSLAMFGFLCAPSYAEGIVYRLDAQDVIHIEAYEFPNVSGTYRVGAEGMVGLPLLGNVPATGKTAGQLGDEIRSRLSQESREPGVTGASVTVQIVSYRPFFIMGDVAQPGAYPYQPGLTVLKAVSLAGGLYRLQDPGLVRLSRDTFTEAGDLQKLEGRVIELRFKMARLKAELASADKVTFPSDDLYGKDKALVDRLKEREEVIFDTRRQDLQAQLDTLQKLHDFLQQEIASLGTQMKLQDHQLGLEMQELGAVQSLVEKGIATSSRSLELQRQTAAIQSRQQELKTQILHAQEGLAQSEQQMQSLIGNRRQQIASQLQQTESELREARDDIEKTRNLLYESEVLAPQAYGAYLRAGSRPVRYELLRDTQHISVSEITPVEPGDVVQVQYTTPQSGLELVSPAFLSAENVRQD